MVHFIMARRMVSPWCHGCQRAGARRKLVLNGLSPTPFCLFVCFWIPKLWDSVIYHQHGITPQLPTNWLPSRGILRGYTHTCIISLYVLTLYQCDPSPSKKHLKKGRVYFALSMRVQSTKWRSDAMRWAGRRWQWEQKAACSHLSGPGSTARLQMYLKVAHFFQEGSTS
jgi:hypothetical protein